MNEEPTDLTNGTLETPPETAENLPQDANTSLSPKLQNRRKLSRIGLRVAITLGILAVVFLILSIMCHAPGSSGWCMQTDIPLVLITIAGITVLLISTAGYITTSKSYLDKQKHSVLGIAFGIFISLLPTMLLVFLVGDIIQRGPTSGFEADSLWVVFAFAVLIACLNYTLNTIRVVNKQMIITVILIVICFALIGYGVVYTKIYQDHLLICQSVRGCP